MLLSAVSVLVVAQSSSEITERLMNNPVCQNIVVRFITVIRLRHFPSDTRQNSTPRTLFKSKYICIIEMGTQRIIWECVDWICLAQDRNKWRDL